MTNEELEKIVEEVAKDFGYDEAHADFEAFKDFKIRWSRTSEWISMQVSDYLNTADVWILESIMRTLFSKISGKKANYSDEVCGWFLSDRFLAANQPRYIERCRGLSRTTMGRNRDLKDCIDRLVERGLYEPVDHMVIGWEPSRPSKVLGSGSPLMKVVTVAGFMDSPDFPEEIMDYAVFAQLMRASMGFRPDNSRRNEELSDLLDRYPKRADLERRIERMGLRMRRSVPGALTRLFTVRR